MARQRAQARMSSNGQHRGRLTEHQGHWQPPNHDDDDNFQDARRDHLQDENLSSDEEEETDPSYSRNRRDTQTGSSPDEQNIVRRGKQLPVPITNSRKKSKQNHSRDPHNRRNLGTTFSSYPRNKQHLPITVKNYGKNTGEFDNMSSDDATVGFDDQENEQLREQLAQAKEQLKAYKGQGKLKKKSERKKDMEKLIHDMVRDELWRTIKFITHSTQQLEIAEKLREMLKLESHEGDGPVAVAARENWIRIYKGVVTTEINKCRTYVIQRIREAVMEYKDAHEGNFYTMRELRNCCMRKIKEDEHDMFVFYLDKLLPRATGNTDHWGKGKRCFETPTLCHYEGDADKLYVPPSTEGFLMCVLEGYYKVWQKQWAHKKTFGPKATLKVPRGTKENPLTEEDKEWLSIFTNVDAGQREFGGWLPIGINRFVEYTSKIRISRKNSKSATLEAEILAKIRIANDVKVKTVEEFEDKNDKKRKAENDPGEMELIVTYGLEK